MNFSRLPLLKFWSKRELPAYRQTEAAECGLACIAMIATYWGYRIDLRGMRARFSVSLKGSSLKGLITMARAVALRARPLRLERRLLGEIRLPCVLHWDFNHFVVLRAISARHAYIHDPAIGPRRVDLREMDKHFTGIALELVPDAGFQHEIKTQPVKLVALVGKIHGIKGALLKLATLGIALQVCALVSPFYLQWIVDRAIVSGDYSMIHVLGAAFIVLALLQTTISGTRSWITTALASEINFQWLGNAFAHLLRLPISFFEKRHLGDIVSRFGAIQIIQRSLTTQFVEAVLDGILVLCTLIIMSLYSFKLASIPMLAVILYAVIRWAAFHSLREATAEQILFAARQSTFFLESARGVQSIRLFNRSEERRIGWMNMLADQFNAELRVARISISYQAASSIIFNVERVVVVWIAALAVLDGTLTVGMLFAFLSFKDQFSQRISALVDKFFEFRMLRLHAERLADIVLSEAETDGSTTFVDPTAIAPTIEMRNVAYRYSDDEPFVVRHVNLKIEAGESLAITGPSGGGKTTFIKLLLGLLAPTEGEIFVGGMPLNALGLANYREMLGTVMQEDKLFAGSIAENISFFDPEPSMRRIEAAAGLAAVASEIKDMPMRYHTFIGDIGSGLSGGQKQRILLARALYRKPRILVLDEATSHLDVSNEHLVNHAISELDLTRVIVAHRPETVESAARVVTLEGGRIVNDRRNRCATQPSAMVSSDTLVTTQAEI
jgi:ATP-binding cassette subfamily B protein RaxB